MRSRVPQSASLYLRLRAAQFWCRAPFLGRAQLAIQAARYGTRERVPFRAQDLKFLAAIHLSFDKLLVDVAPEPTLVRLG